MDGQHGITNDKSASNISSSDNGLSGNTNEEGKLIKERGLTYSPLGRIMNKIGLKLGS